jgi:hypothetical protein
MHQLMAGSYRVLINVEAAAVTATTTTTTTM